MTPHENTVTKIKKKMHFYLKIKNASLQAGPELIAGVQSPHVYTESYGRGGITGYQSTKQRQKIPIKNI